MLVLSRAPGQGVVLPGLQTRVSILQVKGKRVRVGVQAPPNVAVHRDETWEKIQSRWPHAGDEIHGQGSNAPLDVLWIVPGADRRQSLIEDAGAGPLRLTVVGSPSECLKELTWRRADMVAVSWHACDAAAEFLDAVRGHEDFAEVPVVLIPTRQGDFDLHHDWPAIVERMNLPHDGPKAAREQAARRNTVRRGQALSTT